MKRRDRLFLVVFFVWTFSLLAPVGVRANCQDPDLRQKVAETAKAERVNETELLSVIAHESGCRYYTVAWNLPRHPETAKSKFLNSQKEAKALAESLIATKSFRVDIGIGQVNNEAQIQPRGWTLDEVLNPATALNRVAQVLKERGWKSYHSNNPALAEKWRKSALAALNKEFSNETTIYLKGLKKRMPIRRNNASCLIIFNLLDEEKCEDN